MCWNIRIRSGLLALLIGAAGCTAVGAQQPSSAGVTWRVENPFRFFKRPKDTEYIWNAYRTLRSELRRAPTIQEVERKLARDTEGRGWAAEIHGEDVAGSVVQERCWYRRDAACSDYVRPASHRIEARVSGAVGMCEWRRNNRPVAERPQDCTQPIAIDIPYPKGAEISVHAQGRLIAQTAVAVRDLLIVSLGDSFGSGEGNPDRAVQFYNGRVVHYDMSNRDLQGYPSRAGDWQTTGDPGFTSGDARWLHRPCHRSLYSQHVRLAMHVALSDEDGHSAVTFVGVACTGSEIKNLFEPATARDETGDSERVTSPQLSSISRALCAGAQVEPLAIRFEVASRDRSSGDRTAHYTVDVCPKAKARPIDLVLLSIGGNDVGFGSLVASAVLRPDVLDPLYKMDIGEAKQRARLLRRNYATVNQALRTILHVTDPRRVLLTAYPPMAFDSAGQPCAANWRGMDVLTMYRLQPRKAEEVEQFVANDLLPAMRDAASTHGWTLVDSHRQEFKRHGVCAGGGDTADSAAQEFGFPRRRGPPEVAHGTARSLSPKGAAKYTGEGAGRRETVPHQWTWQPYPPDRYRPYWPRARWFRTPNDAFLTVNLHERGRPGNLLDVVQFIAYSGAFHPNAEGHAAIADAVFLKILDARLLPANMRVRR
ncbi:MAG: hypothetical protein ACREC6_04370 [Hyphomicrobiaceae bacterium]